MTLQDAREWAVENGYEDAREFDMSDGRKVYLLVTSAAVGLPRYIEETAFGFVASDDEESAVLLRELARTEEDDG